MQSGFGTQINTEYNEELDVDYRDLNLEKKNWVKYEGEFEEGAMNGFGTIFYPS